MNKKNPLTFICVQPSIPYYAWQVEVMLTNFRDLLIHDEFNIHCLFAFNKNEFDWQEKVNNIKLVESKFEGIADFFYYEDTRQYPISYISSIRPNVLKQHYKVNPLLTYETQFYHDCDIIFSKFPDFLHGLTENDNNWYVSDTISYISHRYIKEKGDDVLDLMCSIVGIDKELVKQNQDNSGGCHYVLKGVDYDFFDKMEKDCEIMFKEVTALNVQKKLADPSHHELQIWCTDMWCILWGAWLKGYKTNIIEKMDFCWSTDSIEKFNDKYIFHNAGCTHEMKDKTFYKGEFMTKYPYDIDFEKYDKTKASYKYVSLIKEVSNKTCLK
jgi:hypothetical protein